MAKKIILRLSVLAAVVGCALLSIGCASIPYSGQLEMIGESNKKANAESFAYYDYVLETNKTKIITGTAESNMVEQVGDRIRNAAEKWAEANGKSNYLENFEWEYHLIRSNEINAWCMPGGKIVVYTGILPITKNADGLAAIMGHEVAHALLLHSQRKKSAGGIPAKIAALFIGIGKVTLVQAGVENVQFGNEKFQTTMPFSRAMEIEADKLGLTLMTIAGYNPDEAAAVWERVSAFSDGETPEYFSTHPSHSRRANNLRKEIPVAQSISAKVQEGRPARQFLEKTISIGGGGVYMGRGNDDSLYKSQSGKGGNIFIDVKFIEADINIIPDFGNDIKKESLYFMGGLAFKFPFSLNDKIAWFPSIGVDIENSSYGYQELGFGARLGVGFDWSIIKRLFLRGKFNIGIPFYTIENTLYGYVNFFVGIGCAIW